MNFEGLSKDVSERMLRLVNYILSLPVSLSDKKTLLIKSFRTVGYEFFNKVFEDSSELFDSKAISTLGYNDPDGQIERLAAKLVQNYNLGRISNPATVKDFYDSLLGDAQHEAFRNAVSLDKHPTLTRRIVGETCGWCVAKSGTYINPAGEDFARHAGCDCLITVSGYNSRNGVLTNYNKRDGVNRDRVFNDEKPGVGTVKFEDGTSIKDQHRKADDFAVAERLKVKYGGNYTVLKEATAQGVSMPDLMRNNDALIEIKRPNTLAALDGRLRGAMDQLDYSSNLVKGIKNRVVYIDAMDRLDSISREEIMNTVCRRVDRYDYYRIDGVIVHRDGEEDIVMLFDK